MKRITSVALAAGLALGAVGVAMAPAAQAAGKVVTSSCANVIVLGVRGSGEPETVTGALYRFGTRTTPVAKAIASKLGSSTTIKYEGVKYSAVSATDWKNYIGSGLKASAMDKSVAEGRDAIISRISYYRSACPSAKLVVVGYSQGAWAAHDAVAKYGEKASGLSNVAAVILLADPATVGSKYQTVLVNRDGKPTGADTSKVKGVSRVSPNFTSTLQDWSRTLSICGDRDVVCSTGLKSDFDAHSKTYTRGSVADIAANYATQRLRSSNRNGICDAGEFCAYKDANHKNIVLDVAVPEGYKRIDVPDDVVSSVWNRSSFTWYGRNQRTGSSDTTLLTVRSGAKVATPASSWNDKIDHLNAG